MATTETTWQPDLAKANVLISLLTGEVATLNNRLKHLVISEEGMPLYAEIARLKQRNHTLSDTQLEAGANILQEAINQNGGKPSEEAYEWVEQIYRAMLDAALAAERKELKK